MLWGKISVVPTPGEKKKGGWRRVCGVLGLFFMTVVEKMKAPGDMAPHNEGIQPLKAL